MVTLAVADLWESTLWGRKRKQSRVFGTFLARCDFIMYIYFNFSFFGLKYNVLGHISQPQLL